jgi:predicted dehydrogenase
VGPPEKVGGTILNKVFSRDVEDEVYSTFYFADGSSGQIAANWSDETYRKMSTRVTLWGTNGRMSVERQEIQTYVRETTGIDPSLNKGWNLRYTTDLTEEVAYYLRGEEYSAQIDHFVRCILDRSGDNVSSFASAVQADKVVAMMLEDAMDGRIKSRTRAAAPDIVEEPVVRRRFFRSLRDPLR